MADTDKTSLAVVVAAEYANITDQIPSACSRAAHVKMLVQLVSRFGLLAENHGAALATAEHDKAHQSLVDAVANNQRRERLGDEGYLTSVMVATLMKHRLPTRI